MNDRQLATGEQESMAINSSSLPSSTGQGQQVTPELFTPQSTTTAIAPTGQEQTSSGIQVQLISPAMSKYNTRSVPFSKGQLVLQLQGAGVKALDKEALQLYFYKKNQEGGPSEQIKEESFLIKPLLQEQGEERYLLKLDFNFEQHFPSLTEGDFFSFQLLQQPKAIVRYAPKQEQIGPEGVEYIQDKLKNLTVSYLKEEDIPILQNLLPDLALKRRKDNKPYVKTEALIAALKAKEMPLLANSKLEQLDKEALEQQLKTYQEQQAFLQKLLYNYDYYAYPYEQLASNEVGATATQEDNYSATVAEHQAIKGLFTQKLLAVQAQFQQVEQSFAQQSIPQAIQEEAAQLEGHKVVLNQQLELMEADMHAMKVLPLSFRDWKQHLQELEAALVTSKEAYTTAKATYKAALKSYNKAHPELTQNPYYIEWYKQQQSNNRSFEKGLHQNLALLQQFAAEKNIPLAATGGDGKLEYREGENKVNEQEQQRFGDKNKATVVFKSLQVPIIDKDGIEPKDVIQGGVGDCYLMAAMMMIAEEETKHLIEEMIVDQGAFYVVTLYSNGMPVAIEVDKKTLWLEFNDGREGDLGANTERELWPAIIEKAYAKLQTNMPPLKEQLRLAEAGNYEEKLPLNPPDYGGDYTQIEGSQTSVSIQALVGNRLSKQEYIYLDEQGQVSEEETPRAFPVSLALQASQYTEEDLAAVVQASFEAGYKVGVDSPESLSGVEGLTHDYLIEISPKKYMKFNHAYVIGQTNEKEVQLIDPHGNLSGEDKFFYTKKLVDNIEKLYKQIDDLAEELESSNHQTFSLETSKNLNTTFTLLADYMKDTPIEKLHTKWERFKNRKELKEEENNWIGLSQRAGVSFMEQINKIVPNIKQTDIGKGFWKGKDQKITGKQEINYSVLREYFHAIRINKLNK
ncbi:MAG: C2 family cysteine protease [Aureispira sp.]